MSGDISESAGIEDLSTSGDCSWDQSSRQNRESPQLDAAGFAEERRLSRRTSLLPDVPSVPTFRGQIADCTFALLLIVSRVCFVIAAATGGILSGYVGAFVGLAGGWILGLWMRWSLGLRRRRLTHGFVVRMLERGNNDRPKLLELLVETLRGHRLSAKECRLVAAAYGEAARQLQTCDSPPDRAEIMSQRDRKVLETVCGRQAHRSSRPFIRKPATYREVTPTKRTPGPRRSCR